MSSEFTGVGGWGTRAGSDARILGHKSDLRGPEGDLPVKLKLESSRPIKNV